MSTRGKLFAILAVSTVLRLIAAAVWDLGNDEAYHALYRDHLDWCFFDHPPMVALIASIGPTLAGGQVSPFTLRLGFVLLFAGSTWLLARITERLFGASAGLYAAFLFAVSGYFGLAAAMFVLPDGPLVFFWLLAVDRLIAAMGSERGIRPWVWVGLAVGGALLSKFMAFLWPACVACWWIADRNQRRWLARPGPYIALLIAFAVASPIAIWNAQHGWATFTFQSGRAKFVGELHPLGPFAMLAAQAAYLFPWVWVALARGVWSVRRRGLPSSDRLFFAFAVPPLLVFLLISVWRSVLPHWALVGYLTLLPLAGRDWSERAAGQGKLRGRMFSFAVAPVVVFALATGLGRFGWFQPGSPLGLIAAEIDPTLDAYGWNQVAAELKSRGLLDRPGVFLATGCWYESAQLAVATGRGVPVTCFDSEDARGFAFWSKPRDWVGREVVLVVVEPSSTQPAAYEPFLDRIESLGECAITRGGAVVRRMGLYRGRVVRAFPFDNDPAPEPTEQVAGSPDGASRR